MQTENVGSISFYIRQPDLRCISGPYKSAREALALCVWGQRPYREVFGSNSAASVVTENDGALYVHSRWGRTAINDDGTYVNPN